MGEIYKYYLNKWRMYHQTINNIKKSLMFLIFFYKHYVYLLLNRWNANNCKKLENIAGFLIRKITLVKNKQQQQQNRKKKKPTNVIFGVLGEFCLRSYFNEFLNFSDASLISMCMSSDAAAKYFWSMQFLKFLALLFSFFEC